MASSLRASALQGSRVSYASVIGGARPSPPPPSPPPAMMATRGLRMRSQQRLEAGHLFSRPSRGDGSSRARAGLRCAASEPGGVEAAGAEQLKASLVELLGEGEQGTARMARVADQRKRLEQLVQDLCELNPTPRPVESPMLLGRWQLLTTYKPGTADVQFFSAESWRKYIFEQGPSPVQSLVLGNTQSVAGVSQLLEDPAQAAARWQNVVAFGQGNQLVIEAELEGIRDESSFFYRFSGGFFKLEGGTKVPYPVPFGLLEAVRPGQTRGWFSTLYLDEDFRVSMGNKGSIFVLRRPPGDAEAAASEPLID